MDTEPSCINCMHRETCQYWRDLLRVLSNLHPQWPLSISTSALGSVIGGGCGYYAQAPDKGAQNHENNGA